MATLQDEIRTERLLLRPPTLDDAPRMAELANDERIARNLTPVFPHPYTLADAEEFIPTAEGLAITTLDAVGNLTPGVIGVVGSNVLAGEHTGVLSFGYWLAVEAWGQGFGTEAARAYLDAIIPIVQPRRVEAMVYGWNPASARILEKLGFTLEARCRERVQHFGDVTDELIYGLVL